MPREKGWLATLPAMYAGVRYATPQIESFTDTEVSFCYSAHEEHGRKERLTKLSLPREEFIRRYLQQVPEPGPQVVRS